MDANVASNATMPQQKSSDNNKESQGLRKREEKSPPTKDRSSSSSFKDPSNHLADIIGMETPRRATRSMTARLGSLCEEIRNRDCTDTALNDVLRMRVVTPLSNKPMKEEPPKEFFQEEDETEEASHRVKRSMTFSEINNQRRVTRSMASVTSATSIIQEENEMEQAAHRVTRAKMCREINNQDSLAETIQAEDTGDMTRVKLPMTKNHQSNHQNFTSVTSATLRDNQEENQTEEKPSQHRVSTRSMKIREINDQRRATRSMTKNRESNHQNSMSGTFAGSKNNRQPSGASRRTKKKRVHSKNNPNQEIWDLIRHATATDEKRPCSVKCCNRMVVAVWATNLKPKDEWYTCEECQVAEFDGWPEGEEPKSNKACWTLVRHATLEDEVVPCSNTPGCKHKVVAVWATKIHPEAKWFTCKECNLKDEGSSEDELSKDVEPSVEVEEQNSKKSQSSSSQKRPCGEKNASSLTSQKRARSSTATLTRRTIEEPEDAHIVTTVGDEDVLLGRNYNNHAGNERLRQQVEVMSEDELSKDVEPSAEVEVQNSKKSQSSSSQKRPCGEKNASSLTSQKRARSSTATSTRRTIEEPEDAHIVTTVGDEDVLFGRNHNHAGNVRLRQQVEVMSAEYNTSSRKKEIADSLVQDVKSRGGRFLKPLEGERWVEVSDKMAETKVSVRFRNYRKRKNEDDKKQKATDIDKSVSIDGSTTNTYPGLTHMSTLRQTTRDGHPNASSRTVHNLTKIDIPIAGAESRTNTWANRRHLLPTIIQDDHPNAISCTDHKATNFSVAGPTTNTFADPGHFPPTTQDGLVNNAGSRLSIFDSPTEIGMLPKRKATKIDIPIATAGSTIIATRANRRHVLPKRKATKIIAGSTIIATRANRRHMLPTTQDGHPIQIHRPRPMSFQRTWPIPRSSIPLHGQRGHVSTNASIRVDEHETDRRTARSVSAECDVPDLVAESTEPSRPMKSPDDRTVVTIKYRRLSCDENNNATTRNTWTGSKVLLWVPKNDTSRQRVFEYKLRRGGTLKVYPNLISPERLASIEKEVLNCGLFRQYRVQAQDEPRVHFLLHEKATENFDGIQPSYSYSKVWIKARPLSKLPLLQTLSKELADSSNVESWNIGVNPVLYRGSHDSMGEHADDDQGEQVILCLIVSSPKRARRVRITPKARGEEGENDDENIELILSEGDAYEMDGEMQEHYFHSVPKTKDSADKSDESDSVRLCIVFRTGRDFCQSQDSGRKCEDLNPKDIPQQIFGNGISGLHEGDVYSRAQLFQMGAHRMQQRGISGNIMTGCDAIIVSGLREDKLGCDRFLQFVYAVEQKKGGKSVLTSYDKGLPIRVFRSSHYQSPYKATSLTPSSSSSTMYRYDGLYKVVRYRNPVAPGRPFIFELHRLDGYRPDDPGNEPRNLFSNSQVMTKYSELGTISVQEGYDATTTGGLFLFQNLIDTVHDTFGDVQQNNNNSSEAHLHGQEIGMMMEDENPPPTYSHMMQTFQDFNIPCILGGFTRGHWRPPPAAIMGNDDDDDDATSTTTRPSDDFFPTQLSAV